MAKKTLADIKKCPIDFLYLWASDEFISQLGSRASVISKKKYYQYQTLWKTMVDNVGSKTTEEYQNLYAQWTSEIAEAIKSVYGLTPAEIMYKLAIGENVVGKNWRSGIYGTEDGVQSGFSQAPNVTVDGTTGKIYRDGVELQNQTPVYGADGNLTGYSVLAGDVQFQSNLSSGGQYGAYSYSKGDGTIQNANGDAFDATQGSFWQNANNYMPIIKNILDWVVSIVNSFFPNRTVLTEDNTVPQQTEWIEPENNGMLVAGGLALAGLLLVGMEDPKKKNKNK